ncbi:MAG: glycosyltransferase family 39 protein, partial [Patescibacteria group bacterium]
MKKPILILIIIGIIVNAVFFIVFGSRVDWRQDYFIGEGDTAEYYILAKNMLAGNGFSFSESPPYFPTRFRTPAYPLFIAAILAVAKNVFAVLIFQNILTILSAVILYLIARSLFGKGKLAFGLAVIFLLDPLILRHQNSLMSETVFVLLILLGFYYFWRYFEKNNIADVIFSGFFIGLAALTKPIAQFLPLVLA